MAALAALCGLLFTAAAPAQATVQARHGSRFVVSEAQFERMFPDRNTFYTYDGLLEATEAYPAFARTGSRTVRKQEAAALVPAELLEGTSLIGPEGLVAERVAAMKQAGVGTLNVTPLAGSHAERVHLIERVRDLTA